MPSKNLKIGSLLLDHSNPRIPTVENQRDALQRILNDQEEKLANLAEDILDRGMNPADNFLVLRSPAAQDKFIVLEGNRRLAALKILHNPALLTGLTVSNSLRKRFETAAQSFIAEDVEPLSCFEVADREEAKLWIQRRHAGEDGGRGIVNWDALSAARFRGSDPALQALEFVREHGDLSDDQLSLLEGRFITTLRRLLETPDVRTLLGLELDRQRLLSVVGPEEVIKGLRRIVLDLADKRINVTQLKKKPQMVEYVSGLDRKDRPNLGKTLPAPRPLDGLMSPSSVSPPQPGRPASPPKPRSKPSPPRLAVVAKPYRLNVTNPKVDEIFGELKSLRLDTHPHAIAVLLRVFLELSVDTYLVAEGLGTTHKVKKTGHVMDKSLRVKVDETVKHLLAKGAGSPKDYAGVTRAVSHTDHPLSPDLLHAYVHNRFVTPISKELTAAWDNALPLFERIWK